MLWIPETSSRGISDEEIADLASTEERAVLTRDRDFLATRLRRRATHGVIYIAEPVRRDNVEKLARNINKALEALREKPGLAIVTSTTIELYRLP